HPVLLQLADSSPAPGSLAPGDWAFAICWARVGAHQTHVAVPPQPNVVGVAVPPLGRGLITNVDQAFFFGGPGRGGRVSVQAELPVMGRAISAPGVSLSAPINIAITFHGSILPQLQEEM